MSLMCGAEDQTPARHKPQGETKGNIVFHYSSEGNMAASNVLHNLSDEASCSICLEYFTDPVITDCGHNFCRSCITLSWEGLQRNLPCPQCREICQNRKLRPNRQLTNIVEMLKQLRIPSVNPQENNRCPEHDEKLKLFCEDDQKPICVVCSMSRDHKPHAVLPIGEAAQEYKERIQIFLNARKRELEDILGLQCGEEKDMKKLEEMFKRQREMIMNEFEMLKQYLEEEKCQFITSLEEEEKEVLKKMKGNVTQLEEERSFLRSLIADVEGKCQQQDVELLKDVKSTLNRIENVRIQKPEMGSPEEEKHVKSLFQRLADLQDIVSDFRERFHVELDCKRARSFAREVTLDPDTAHCNLLLSEDATSVRNSDTAQDLPDTPERFNHASIVLGRERLTSGRHYWEVEVGDTTDWELGVCDESVSRKGELTLTPARGYWTVWLRNDEYEALTSPPTRLIQRVRPRVVGVFLDYEAERLSFYNVEAMSMLFSFPQAFFPRTIRPYFSPCLSDGGKNAGMLRILPVAAED